MPEKYYSLGDETEQVEFKKSTGELKEAVISIAAILNKHGSGDLYFGVKNNGDVIGQDITDKTTREVSQAIGSRYTAPALFRKRSRRRNLRREIRKQSAGTS